MKNEPNGAKTKHSHCIFGTIISEQPLNHSPMPQTPETHERTGLVFLFPITYFTSKLLTQANFYFFLSIV
jgi:hypothetical protein